MLRGSKAFIRLMESEENGLSSSERIIQDINKIFVLMERIRLATGGNPY